MKINKRLTVSFAVLSTILIVIMGMFYMREKNTAMIIYKDSINSSNIVKKVSWDEKEIIATVLNVLNNCEPTDFDISQKPEYIISIKRNQPRIFLLEQPAYFNICIYKVELDAIVLYCDDIGNGRKIEPSKVLNKTFSEFMLATT